MGRLYGHALSGVRVLRFDGASAPRVLKFDMACGHEGCGGRPSKRRGASMYKTFTTGLRPMENRPTALAGVEKRSPFGGYGTTFPPIQGALWVLSIVPHDSTGKH